AVRLALAVDALLQPEADEGVLGLLTGEEPLRAFVEVVELALEDRDDVAGDVLVDLGVLERARAARGGGGRLHKSAQYTEMRRHFGLLASGFKPKASSGREA